MADIWPITFDAKKCAFRQSKDGIVLSLVVHPNADCIAILAAAEIGFDFQVTICPMTAAPSPAGGTTGKEMASQAPAGGAKTEGERAVQRAGILAKDERFKRWTDQQGWESAMFIRQRCRIASRAEIATKPGALGEFYRIEAEYRAWAQESPL